MPLDPNDAQKLSERVDALEKEMLSWKVRYEENRRISWVVGGVGALMLILQALSRR